PRDGEHLRGDVRHAHPHRGPGHHGAGRDPVAWRKDAAMELGGKVALVTGAARGLGRAIVRRCLFLSWFPREFCQPRKLIATAILSLFDHVDPLGADPPGKTKSCGGGFTLLSPHPRPSPSGRGENRALAFPSHPSRMLASAHSVSEN